MRVGIPEGMMEGMPEGLNNNNNIDAAMDLDSLKKSTFLYTPSVYVVDAGLFRVNCWINLMLFPYILLKYLHTYVKIGWIL